MASARTGEPVAEYRLTTRCHPGAELEGVTRCHPLAGSPSADGRAMVVAHIGLCVLALLPFGDSPPLARGSGAFFCLTARWPGVQAVGHE